MKTFKEYLAEAKIEKEMYLNESKINLSNVKYGNFWGDILEVIGNDAVGAPGSETLEQFLARIVIYAAKLELEHLEDNKDEIDEDNYEAIINKVTPLSDKKTKIIIK